MRSLPVAAGLVLLLAPTTARADDPLGPLELASVSTPGVQGDAHSGTGFASQRVALSGNGRVVAFLSEATNLVPGDTNGLRDAFVRDLDTDETTRVSVSSLGAQADDDVLDVDVSRDGRNVCFTTRAATLVALDTNGQRDVFVHDRVLGTTELISHDFNGGPANNGSESGRLSREGRYVSFWSGASDIVPNDQNSLGDIYRYDRWTDTVLLVSVSTNGVQANDNCAFHDISPDGHTIAFSCIADNLTPFYDLNDAYDVFVRDLVAGTTERVGPHLPTPEWDANSWKPSISADGQQVVFESLATNVLPGDANGEEDVFLWDRPSQSVALLASALGGGYPNHESTHARISADGLWAAFQSRATDLVVGDTNNSSDVFLVELSTWTTTRASLTSGGAQANLLSTDVSLSEDAALLAFTSAATNLVPGDANGNYDVFVRQCAAPEPELFCSGSDNSQGCATTISWSGTPSATAGSGFELLGGNMLNQQPGILIYSTSGATELPFGFGTLCLLPTIVRTPVQFAGGTPLPAVDCSGSYSFDLNAWIAGDNDPALVAGASVWAQYWSRDPGFAPPNNTNLTEGLRLVVGP